MLFWIIIGVLAVAVAALLAVALVRGRRDAEHPAAYDLRVYRDQLKEVDRDLARGVIGADDAERIRAEISRRILAADAQLHEARDSGDQPAGVSRAVAGGTAAVLVAGAIGIYWQLGAPGYGDLGLKDRIETAREFRENRPSQEQAEAQVALPDLPQTPSEQYIELVKRLREAVAQRPGDLQGQTLLARNEAALGNFKAAYEAQQAVLSIKGAEATASDYADYADMMILAAGGYVSPQAETALRAALARDPGNGTARYYMGLMAAQTGRPDQAFRVWDALLKEGPSDAPWVAPIRGQIEEMAARAGVNYTLPAMDSLPGPTAADMANAANMTPAERQEMVRGMVDRLMNRLATQGGSAEEWARLIVALGQLGDTARATAIFNEAQQVFAERPQMLATVRAAAAQAGLTGAATLPGPTAEDMENAAEMAPDDRQDMIRNMVARLAERLNADGGSPQEWARLISSYGVLGDAEGAKIAYQTARAAFEDDQAALGLIDDAARAAGLSE
ncbi:cytochrome c-type biogenesis protein CcmH [Lutimaribacter saemankumensis]|uniref:Cytochrome c-type biogenesis protein CcmH n=1 Tax=Lutimaribacter saemankumensis TaxID=490829 RepID=A0A1G8H331_9RHOB|nr:cytochrome c-type biogenesis protein CcmH [Lutimaribacter saemankumensis]